MEPTLIPRVKICCIGSLQEAHTAIRYGAPGLGLVSEMPSGRVIITEATITTIADSIRPRITSILLTSKQDPEAIIAQQRRCHVNALQLVDKLPEGGPCFLRNALPGIFIIQVIHIMGPEAIEEALAV